MFGVGFLLLFKVWYVVCLVVLLYAGLSCLISGNFIANYDGIFQFFSSAGFVGLCHFSFTFYTVVFYSFVCCLLLVTVAPNK